MSDETITFLILGAAVVVFVWDRLPVAVVAFGVALSLWATGVLDLEQAFAGFGDPTVIFIASLFVVSEALESTGVTAWLGQELIERAGDDRRRILVLTMTLVAVVTAFISVNAAVAALIPVAVVTAVRLRLPASQLLLPVAFAAHAGSLLALTGTPVNVIVTDYASEAGVERFGFFEFGLVGLPLVVGTIVIVVLLGRRLLPERNPKAITRDFSSHARTLVEHYGLEDAADTLLTRRSGVAEVVIPPRSSLIGESAFPGMVTDSGDLVVLALQRRGRSLRGSKCWLRGTRCCSRERGARSTSTSAIRTYSSSTSPGSCAGRPCRWARVRSGPSPSSSGWCSSSRPASCPRRSPGCSPPERSC